MTGIDAIAMWIGFAILVAGGLALAACAVGLAMNYAYRKMLKDLPTLRYVQQAVAEYRRRYPPSRWAQDLKAKDDYESAKARGWRD